IPAGWGGDSSCAGLGILENLRLMTCDTDPVGPASLARRLNFFASTAWHLLRSRKGGGSLERRCMPTGWTQSTERRAARRNIGASRARAKAKSAAAGDRF